MSPIGRRDADPGDGDVAGRSHTGDTADPPERASAGRSGELRQGERDLVLERIENPVGEYPERPFEEASEGVVRFNPANEDHQDLRVQNSHDYVDDGSSRPGYLAPDYSEIEA